MIKNSKIILVLAISLVLPILIMASSTAESYKSYVHDESITKTPKLNVQGVFETMLWTGAATYNYPVETPPGRNELTPTMSLTYNSYSTAQRPGILGTGWALSENYILRDVDYSFSSTVDDKFKLFFGGQLFELFYNASDGRYHTKTETNLYINSFAGANNSYGEYWIVRTKDGSQYRFGYNNESELISNLHNYVSKWSLDLITDTYNNQISYSYLENPHPNDYGTIYPYKIEYNNEKSRVIEFVLENSDRPDKWLVYEQGNKIRESRRIKEIQIKTNGNLVRKYVLNYSLIDTNSRSFLSSVTIYGSDNASLFPSTKFDYQNISKGWLEDKNFVSPLTLAGVNRDLGVRLTDFNRDGLIDITRYDPWRANDEPTVYYSSWINNGSGWTRNDSWNAPTAIINETDYDSDADLGVRFIDFNGDGLTDIVRGDGNIRESYVNLGNGWSSDNSTWHLPTNANPVLSSSGIYGRGVQFYDLNGDGLVDILSATDDWSYAWINNGSGWITDNSWKVPTGAEFVIYPSGEDQGVRVDDVNGDELVDLVKGKGTTMRTWINNGSGWYEDTSWDIPSNATFVKSGSSEDEGVRLVDINGDGLTDLLKGKAKEEKKAWINNGSGWYEDSSWIVPEKEIFVIEDGRNLAVRIVDVNGDGLSDLMFGGDGPITFINKGAKTYLLKNLTNNLGGSTSIYYKKISTFNNSGSDGISDIGFNLWAVDEVLENNSISGTHNLLKETSHFYVGGLYDYGDKEFRGFSRADEIRPNLSVIKHYFYQDDYLKGKEYQIEVFDTNSKPFQKAFFNWSLVKNFGNYSIIQLSNEINYLYDGSYDSPKITEIKYTYDDYGNVKIVNDLGDNETQTDNLYHYFDYIYNTTSWIVNKPKNYTVYDYDNTTKIKEILYSYDKLPYGQSPVKGSLTSKQDWLNIGGLNPITNYSYDSFGNVVNETDANGYVTKYTYGIRDNTSTFADQITNAKGHVVNYNYDLGTGNILSLTDPNGVVTNYSYDVFGRISKEILPYDSPTYPTIEYEYETDGISPEKVKIKQREENNTAKTYDEYYFYDGLGNVVQYKEETDNGTQVVTYTNYDGLNRIVRQSTPYFAQLSENYTTPNLSISGTIYEYDPLSRTTRIQNADNSTQVANFDHWSITLYDENNNTKKYDLDSRGQIIRLTDYLDNNYFKTNYVYDKNKNLILITDVFGKVFNYSYDSLNRKTKEINPDTGTWEYGYDKLGNLIWQKDSNGANISFTYDGLNRPTSRISNEETTNYSYDSINGTLNNITRTGVTIKFSYDNRLRTTQENVLIDGKEFVKKFRYNSLDKLTSETMPDGSLITYNYSNWSLISSIPGIISGISYNSFGSPTTIPYSNSLNTIKNYNLNNNRVSKIKTGSGSSQDFDYQYDMFGNIIKLGDNAKIFNNTIVYDDLYRLISSNNSNSTQTSFAYNYTYDFIGRLIKMEDFKNNVTLNYYYGSDPFHAPKKITGLPDESINLGISFTNGTENDNASVQRNWVYANVSVNGSDNNIVFSLYNESVSKNGLVLWLGLDENRSSLIDRSLNGNNGNVSGALFNSNGRLNGGYLFDGTDDALQTMSSVNAGTNQVTVSLWTKTNALSTGDDILAELSNNYNSFTDSWVIYHASAEYVEACLKGSVYSCWNSTYALPIGEWTHIVAVFDWNLTANESKIYINGNLMGVPRINNNNTDRNFGNRTVYVGARGASSNHFNGTIDEVRIYNRSLSATEISEIYNSRAVRADNFTNQTRSINWTGLPFGDYYYNVYVSNSNAQNITETRSINLFSLIDVNSLTQLYSTASTERTFGFFITNFNSTTMNNVTWKFNTGTQNITSQFTSNLSAGDSKYVVFEYNYSAPGTYNVIATALGGDGSISDSETIQVTV